MDTLRDLSLIDGVIAQCDNAFRTLHATNRAHARRRPDASVDLDKAILTRMEKKLSGALMRVDHAGEVCAQALYQGQACASKTAHLKQSLQQSADEENDHLAWCEARLRELDAHTSYLGLFWYAGSFVIGFAMGLVGDEWSLGFIVETENQVVKHLESHLARLPPNDYRSRVILEQMKTDEQAHASKAISYGARELPFVVKQVMRQLSRVMTSVAFWV